MLIKKVCSLIILLSFFSISPAMAGGLRVFSNCKDKTRTFPCFINPQDEIKVFSILLDENHHNVSAKVFFKHRYQKPSYLDTATERILHPYPCHYAGEKHRLSAVSIGIFETFKGEVNMWYPIYRGSYKKAHCTTTASSKKSLSDALRKLRALKINPKKPLKPLQLEVDNKDTIEKFSVKGKRFSLHDVHLKDLYAMKNKTEIQKAMYAIASDSITGVCFKPQGCNIRGVFLWDIKLKKTVWQRFQEEASTHYGKFKLANAFAAGKYLIFHLNYQRDSASNTKPTVKQHIFTKPVNML